MTARGRAPDPAAPMWTTSDVAHYLGVAVGTVSAYRGRGQMPTPVGRVGSSWVWHPPVIVAWAASRPRSRRAAEEVR